MYAYSSLLCGICEVVICDFVIKDLVGSAGSREGFFYLCLLSLT